MRTFLLSLMVLAAAYFLFVTDACRRGVSVTPSTTDTDGLPPATQKGAGVFACLVDGKPWIANPISVFGIHGRYDGYSLAVGGGLENSYDLEDFAIDVNLRLNKITTNISYDLSDTAGNYAMFYSAGDTCFVDTTGGYGDNVALVYATKGGVIITKLDTVKNIVSGTFWFDIPTDYCDTMK